MDSKQPNCSTRAQSTRLPPYPPPPWRLTGASIQTLRAVEIATVRPTLPPLVRIVPVLPGRTLAALYCARYDGVSVLAYHELIVASALVYAHGRVGFWISEIYVDDPRSQAGGREIWGLPKQLATFRWEPAQGMVEVKRSDTLVSRIEWRPREGSLTSPLWMPVVSQQASRLLYFQARARCRLSLVRGAASVPSGTHVHRFGFEHSRRFMYASHLRLNVSPPQRL